MGIFVQRRRECQSRLGGTKCPQVVQTFAVFLLSIEKDKDYEDS